ncbi:MAG: depolymerase family esterase, partial [Proteobacteria bacterium]|nr:depolymerase family esterase [Pseudomonadota bacterium]
LQDAYVYVPKNAAPAVLGGKRALMLTMHGCGQTASGNVIGTKFNWETTAEQYGMVVVAPTVPSGTTSTRSVSGCWDWFGSAHTRTGRDAVPLKKLLDSVKARTNLDIDPNQIYVTGLSSGGGETIVMGCSFPEYFAGVGINAGPALGSASGDISVEPKVTAAQVASYCKAAATSTYTPYFATQITNAVYGTSDYLVKPNHNVRNIQGMAVVYGMTMGTPVTSSVAGGGTAKVYKDANGKERLSDLAVTGMGHAWPAGGGAGAAYVDTSHVNFPVYITKWFFDNNLRVSGGSTTTTTAATTTTTGGATTTTGAATTTTAAATTTTTRASTTTTTTTTTTTAGACYKTSNYAHVTAGRAYNSLGTAKAKGSNQSMGLNNTFYITKLRMTGTAYYVIDATCP